MADPLLAVSSANSYHSPGSTKMVDPDSPYTALAVRSAIVGAGLTGLVLFLRNSRLFAKFSNASQIPSDFVSKEIGIKGRVREIIPNAVIKVEHEPLIKLPRLLAFTRTAIHPALIDVRLAGLDISPAGIDYLTKDVKIINKNVYFTVIKHGSTNFVDAEVLLKKSFFIQTNLNVDLVRRGYAKVFRLDDIDHLKALQSMPTYSRLISKLLLSEKIADVRGIGMWKRDTWVESLAAYPSQITDIMRSSAVARLLVLVMVMVKDFAQFSFSCGKIALDGLNTVGIYIVKIYEHFSRFVEKLIQLYTRAKQKALKR